jgi:hypothetical protein
MIFIVECSDDSMPVHVAGCSHIHQSAAHDENYEIQGATITDAISAEVARFNVAYTQDGSLPLSADRMFHAAPCCNH